MFTQKDQKKALKLLTSIQDCNADNALKNSEELLNDVFGTKFTEGIGKNGVLRYNSLSGSDESVKYWGLLYEGATTGGPYENFSLVVFPYNTEQGKSDHLLLSFGIGTGGITDDASWLETPWVQRSIHTLLRLVNDNKWNRNNTKTFVKDDLLEENTPIPDDIIAYTGDYSDYSILWKKYGDYLPSICVIDANENGAQAFLAHLLLYGNFRDWKILKHYQDILNSNLFPSLFSKWRKYPNTEDLKQYTLERKYIILQGPPGTGKTYLAEQIASSLKSDNKIEEYDSIQFHPSINYEDFVVGLKPDTTNDNQLVFKKKKGPLVNAIEKAHNSDKGYLLIIDEINRGDIAKVLGEAINLFEIGVKREITLRNGEKCKMPDNLYVIGTMNTADRSIAILDYAVRRRFAFIDIWPSKEILEDLIEDDEVREIAKKYFGKLQTIFFKYANDIDLHLQPGHSYFYANNRAQLERKLKNEVSTLLNEYINEGRLPLAKNQLKALIEDFSF